MAQSLLSQSVASDVNPAQVAIYVTKSNCHQPYIWRKSVPAARDDCTKCFWLFCSFSSVFLSNQMLISTHWGKENRTVEMLTTVKTDTLNTGKILVFDGVALIQILVIVLPVLAGLFGRLGRSCNCLIWTWARCNDPRELVWQSYFLRQLHFIYGNVGWL